MTGLVDDDAPPASLSFLSFLSKFNPEFNAVLHFASLSVQISIDDDDVDVEVESVKKCGVDG